MREVSYKKNPNCYTSKNYVFGDYSTLLKIKDDDEELIEVSSVQVDKYSSLIGKIYNEIENYYTPIGIIIVPNTEAIIGFENIIPLITDPFQFRSYLKNWKNAGFDFDQCVFKIIRCDKDFDEFMRETLTDDMVPVMNPLFDKTPKLVSARPEIGENRDFEAPKN